ncbi:Dot/Icm T4SS effector Zinc-dependent metalloprotease LegP [Nocardia sp. NPDC058379]|uniref:Dot/Icm T4SS effector Zinc-dependent metalloprotease LegP n=1 Tax=unclassified Nocardia TaxID=2637762 RepID=UPI00364F77F9
MIIDDTVPATVEQDDTGEFRSGPEAGTTLIPSATRGLREVPYAAVDDLAVFEGDIVLGTLAEIAARREQEGIVISGAGFRWPNAVVPFEIDPALPGQQRITDAVAHWNSRTRLRFIPRTAQHADFVRFVPSTASRSPVGRQGGMQTIELTSGAPTGTVVHEMGHAIGLWHEQSREDRETFVEIRLANVSAGNRHNFAQHITDGDDVGGYDFGSIMHYPATAFSTNGQDTIVPRVALPPGVTMGQRTALSAGDVGAAHAIYPNWSGAGDRWRGIGGFFPRTAPVTATARRADHLDLFITGNDGRVYTSWWHAGSEWSGFGDRWRNIGGVFPAGAAVGAVARTSNNLDVFTVGNDGRVYTSWWQAGSDWSGIGDRWRNIGGVFPRTARVSATARRSDHLDLFVTGNDGRVYTSWWHQGGDWSGVGDRWRNIGGVFPASARVTSVARTANTLDLFITGNDGRVYTSWWQAGSDWSGIGDRWRTIGGIFPAGAPVTVVARTADHLDLFITGNDGCVYTSWWHQGGDWSGIGNRWRNIGGVFPPGAPVAAVARTSNNLDLFITGNDGRVYTSWWQAGSDWSGIGNRWRNIGGVFPAGGPVAAVARTPGELDAFTTGNDGRVYTSWWEQ